MERYDLLWYMLPFRCILRVRRWGRTGEMEGSKHLDLDLLNFIQRCKHRCKEIFCIILVIYNTINIMNVFWMKMVMFGSCMVCFYCRLSELTWLHLSRMVISISGMVCWMRSVLVSELLFLSGADPISGSYKLWTPSGEIPAVELVPLSSSSG